MDVVHNVHALVGEGDFFASVLVLEHNVSNNQSGRGLSDHPYVLRAGFGNETFGELVAAGMIAAGREEVISMDLELDPSWNKEDLYFAVILWEKDGSEYVFVNGTLEEDFTVVTSVKGTEDQFSLEVMPTILQETARIELEVNQAQQGMLVVHDLLGNKVKELFRGTFIGSKSFDLDRTMFDAPGVYILSFRLQQEQITKRILVK